MGLIKSERAVCERCDLARIHGTRKRQYDCLSGDDLDFLIAAARYAHAIRVMDGIVMTNGVRKRNWHSLPRFPTISPSFVSHLPSLSLAPRSSLPNRLDLNLQV
jgi:hypothetical protein